MSFRVKTCRDKSKTSMVLTSFGVYVEELDGCSILSTTFVLRSLNGLSAEAAEDSVTSELSGLLSRFV